MEQLARDLADAYRVLARLVREEYPGDMSLADIAFTWGDATPEEVEALRRLESGERGG